MLHPSSYVCPAEVMYMVRQTFSLFQHTHTLSVGDGLLFSQCDGTKNSWICRQCSFNPPPEKRTGSVVEEFTFKFRRNITDVLSKGQTQFKRGVRHKFLLGQGVTEPWQSAMVHWFTGLTPDACLQHAVVALQMCFSTGNCNSPSFSYLKRNLSSSGLEVMIVHMTVFLWWCCARGY